MSIILTAAFEDAAEPFREHAQYRPAHTGAVTSKWHFLFPLKAHHAGVNLIRVHLQLNETLCGSLPDLASPNYQSPFDSTNTLQVPVRSPRRRSTGVRRTHTSARLYLNAARLLTSVNPPIGGRDSPSGGQQQGGRSAAVAEGAPADAGHPPEAEGADD